MAKVKKSNIRPAAKKAYTSPFSIYWANQNYLILFAALGFLILGYVLMSVGNWDSWVSLNVSPVVLLIGYVLLLPAAIFMNKRKKKEVK